MQEKDIPAINKMYADSPDICDWPKYPSDQYEAVMVVVDDQDEPLMMAAAVKTVEIYLLCDDRDPRIKKEALKLVHSEMRRAMRANGIERGIAWLQDRVAKPFSRRLVREFGWTVREGPAYLVRSSE